MMLYIYGFAFVKSIKCLTQTEYFVITTQNDFAVDNKHTQTNSRIRFSLASQILRLCTDILIMNKLILFITKQAISF